MSSGKAVFVLLTKRRRGALPNVVQKTMAVHILLYRMSVCSNFFDVVSQMEVAVSPLNLLPNSLF
jgi:hypothetical protein